MAKDSIGVIYGRTGSFTFEFAVPEHVVVKRGEYIKVWHDIDGWTLAQVDGVMRMSDTFQLKQAIDAAEGARTGSVNEKTTAKASVIGFRGTDRLLRTPKTPFSPGDKVFRADEEIITYTLGLIAGDVYLGLLDGQKVRVYLNGDDLVQKHVSVLAKTGSGKSYTAAVILEELLDNGIPMLIIDPHGEYLTLKQPNDDDKKVFNKYKIVPKGYERQVTVYTPADKRINPDADRLFRLNETNLTTSDLSQLLVEDQTQNQTAILYEAINKLKAEDCNYSVEDIILELGQNKSKSKWNLISAIERIKETGLFSKKPTRLEELIKPGHASIIDMKGVDPDIQSMIVAKMCTELFEARKLGKIPPCMLVIEEAHNFCPERGFNKTVSTEILRTIASEGRKFGLGLLVISQRPARVDKNVLSQCNTQIIMKVTNANDLKALSSGLEGLSSGLEEEIKRLPAGVAMIVSNKIERPILVDVRVRKSKHGGTSAAIERGFSYIEDAPPDEHTVEVPERSDVDETVTEKDIIPEILVKPQEDASNDVYMEISEERKEKSLFKKIFGSSK
ncbi:MAG: hypothetical protein DNFNHJIP_00592 [Candidatus Argoarchaeum ethanivorans]|uniref:Helicase HerA central domain-containing protein n=1 Tax=Candidatus Argoarchaeum ethanivorans TaxID=2608793 RepID=A0A812A314_9EURY|nr:MAG: hypothetical protein DNFNHJIP_00592 [Candidatus Argoarchaeum ethanivorans]